MKNIFRQVRQVLGPDFLLCAWVGGLVAGAIALTAGLIENGYAIGHPLGVAILAALAVAAEREGIRLSPAVEVSVASILYVFAAVVYGPIPAVIIGGAGVLADLPRRDVEQPILRWVSWTSIRVIVVGAASVTALSVLSATQRDFWGFFAAVAAAFVVETTADVALTLVAPAIRGVGSWLDSVKSVGPPLLASVPLQAPMVAVLAYSYETISPWSVALFAIPAVAAQRLLLLYRQQRETAGALGEANARLAKANLSFATALVATLDARDRYTAGHSAAVAIYARDIARRMGLSEGQQELVRLCGLVHDVGKIGLPAGLLEKPGALTLDERRQMEQHSVIGERILRNVDDYREIAAVVRHHHERVDGLGYPDNLVGDQIPLLARIISVADSYNAMTSDRPYRDAMPSRVARLRLAQAVESQFDTAVVAAFEALLASADEAYRSGTRADFTLGSAQADFAKSASLPHRAPAAAEAFA
ncbi:MAG TPA: HD-GYP domain-containing protein [Gaiellaceae bacterium]|jgi:putative nucleotidyltransferase with HDIG domain|nr:HD-GYP domain-containing protein [Gaiellaceae bacterium]